MKILKYSAVIIFLFTSFINIKSQCSISSVDILGPSKGDFRTGQTFVACEDGVIQSITLEVIQATANIVFYLGTPISNELAGPYQTFPVPTTGEGVMTTFTFNTPFPVLSGNFYEFQIASSNPYLIGVGGDDFFGTCTTAGLSLSPNDLTTQIQILPATPIPTLSQWGIIALGMIMLILGVVGVRNRKVIFG